MKGGLALDGAGHHAAHEVALQAKEHQQGQNHADEGRGGHQVPVLAFFADQAVWALVIGGASFLIAAGASLLVPREAA